MKTLLKKVIKSLRDVANAMNNAYIETYGDSELAHEFNERLEILKEYNKQRFIGEMAVRYAKKQKEDGLLTTPECAFRQGALMFNEAKRCGDIDELNNLIEKE